MLGSVPRWPCGYIQRPYLLLRFLVLLSLSLSSSLSLFCLPPSFYSSLATLSICAYRNTLTPRRETSSYLTIPFFFPPLPVSIFLLVVAYVFRDSSRFALRGRPLWSLLSPKIMIRSIQFDLLCEIMRIFLWKSFFFSRICGEMEDSFRKYFYRNDRM